MKIVFVINSLVHYHILYDYILKLYKLKSYEITVILVKPELAVKEASLISIASVIKIFEQVELKEKKGEKSFKQKKQKKFYFYWAYFIYLFWKHKCIQKKCEKIIDNLKPNFAIISSDRYTDFDLFFAKQCNKKKIKVAVIGIDYFNVETFEGYLKSNPARKITSFQQKLFSKFFQRQVFQVNSESCLYYPIHLALNLFLMNALPTRPFLTGSRFVNQIHVDSEYTRAKYIEYGVSQNLIRVVGLLEHDLIFESLQQKEILKNKFQIDPLKKIVVLAIPQGWEHHLIDKEKHFDIIERMLSIILKKPITLLLSLHPKMDINNYLYLEKKFSLQISRIPLREFICLSDLFIATYSSTVLWSTLLNIPCLVFDFYDLNYNYFGEIKNVSRTKGFEEFEIAFLQLLSSNHDSEFALNSNSSNHPFGSIDNGVFKRFLKSIHEKD